NASDRVRYMAKFLFTRMSEPTGPTWDHAEPAWKSTDDPQEGIWRHVWDWHRGVPDTPGPASEDTVTALAGRLGSESEIDGLTAPCEGGAWGGAAVPALIRALGEEGEAAPRNAAYGFNRIGEAAVPSLLQAARNVDERVRARALDVLGDMGLSAEAAVPGLL